MKRVAIIGCGGIGLPVIRAVMRREAGNWALAAVLARRAREVEGVGVADTFDAIVAAAPDLVIEAAGPDALRDYGPGSLAIADVWAVSGAALADDPVKTRLEQAGRAAGHRLRLVAGAIAGLDGIAAAAIDPAARVSVGATSELAAQPFRGSAREAARRFPGDVNIGIAAALAGTGLDATEIEVRPLAGGVRRLRLAAESAYGRLAVLIEPRADAAALVHPVAASLIASLRRESQVIWAG